MELRIHAHDVHPVGVRVLGGPPCEALFADAKPTRHSGRFHLFAAGAWTLGSGSVAIGTDVERATLELYRELFAATAGIHLARIWNYVPAINAVTGGLENYGRFCRARAMAFEEKHGAEFHGFVPAASAVGCEGSVLTIAFAASAREPRHVENPLQMPAYEYPADYGPRSPSFARASVVAGADGDTVFVSGTSAIRGHATVAPHCIADQLACTIANLRAISDACGLGPELGRTTHERVFKIYLRDAADEPFAAATLGRDMLQPADNVTYLRADICRAALQIEIEATLRPRSAGKR